MSQKSLSIYQTFIPEIILTCLFWMNDPVSCKIPIKAVTIYLGRALKRTSLLISTHISHLHWSWISAILHCQHLTVQTGPFPCVITHKRPCNVNSHKWPAVPLVHSNECFLCKRHDLQQSPISFSRGALITFSFIHFLQKKKPYVKCSIKGMSNVFHSWCLKSQWKASFFYSYETLSIKKQFP